MLLCYIVSICTLILSAAILIYTIKTQKTRYKLSSTLITHLPVHLVDRSTADIKQYNHVQAHVNLQPSPRFPGTENSIDLTFSSTQHSILYIDQSTKGLVQISSGVDITQEGIKISISGIYYVYSNVNFKPNSTRSSKDFTYQVKM
ncbi:uncharacterized protein LOC131935600 [Physella acuta]|uniref:uncharacterized protein LOC131935600 n=1 Tax=Physella acuta TaxID=109671 RepID=UPI0027DDE660|nr:uncharacterized protein LOC131935600 [Physella acuta]